VENARENMKAELSGWDFDKVADKTADKWEKELGKIVVEGTPVQKQIFYTGLYHAFTQPNNMADVNGDYQASDLTIKNAPDKKHYSTFSLWDTYRAAHPLYTLTQPERSADFVNSMLRQYDTYGYLPIWQLWGDENYCMIGNHAIPVIVDAALKGIKGFDLEKAYEAVKGSSTLNHPGSPFSAWEKYKYIPEDIESQSVSITLEMAYDDWCVAQFAKKLGKTDDYAHFMKRSSYYENLYDSKTGFFRAKNKNGEWLSPFNPLKYGGNGGNPYTEANAWQYFWYVPQNVPALINIVGSDKLFTEKLDQFFSLKDLPGEVNGNASGFIGQYAHGNEPSHHVAYLYDYAGQPWKTQFYVAKILNELYNNSSSGYSGNEDCGQMSSWYTFSSMGFYPVNPASGVYMIGSPILKHASMKLEGGKVFEVTTQNPSAANVYIQSVKLNGKAYDKTYITQKDITKGGKMEFIMGKKPNYKWGTAKTDLPPIEAFSAD
ncbi:MAG TPA: glycoside hydrolase family 92 protein, partial [Pedobacter sp.]